MLNSYNQFHRFCLALCNRAKLGESVFEEFLSALRPLDPCKDTARLSLDTSSIPFSLDQVEAAPSIDQEIETADLLGWHLRAPKKRIDPSQLSDFQQIVLNRMVDLAKDSGYDTSVSEVIDFFQMLKEDGVPRSDVETAFRRCRKTSSSWRARFRRSIGNRGDPLWSEVSYDPEFFVEAILWAEKRARKSKPRAASKYRRLWGLLAASAVLLTASVLIAWATGNWTYGAAPLLLIGILWTVVIAYYGIVH